MQTDGNSSSRSSDTISYDATSTSSSSDTSSSSSSSQEEEYDNIDDYYSLQVKLWVERVPIGLGLCPWARQWQKRLKYISTCNSNARTKDDVTMMIRAEAALLVLGNKKPWSSTLVICPHVIPWNNNFKVFDDFVNNLGKEPDIATKVTLVSFHPEFLRWRGLPENVLTGSVVQSYRDLSAFQQSHDHMLCSATVLEMSNAMFGRRRIKVRFHDDQKKEQYVPTDWIKTVDNDIGSPLPDNAMHQAPYPTVHLIRNDDLATVRVRDVSRVKRMNTQKMMKLGWEGVLLAAAAAKDR